MLTVYISGLHSGPNPSPGVGVVRSLRESFPSLHLVGVDYSSRSSGIHWHQIDELWIQRPWRELDLGTLRDDIVARLDSGAVWITGLDLEAEWLARTLHGRAGVLSPSLSAIRATRKPAIRAHRRLPFFVAPYLEASASDWDLHQFCRRHDWRVWLKSPYYEARRVRSWPEFCTAREDLARTWSTDDIYVQQHVVGHEESIAFAAYNGRLLGAVHMEKRDVTPEGKTWAARVSPLPNELEGSLAQVASHLNWTGGGEIEFVRDNSGKRWVIDWNPRFPAWIYGATISGSNLPSMLVQAATGHESDQQASSAPAYFTRVVLEIPVVDQFAPTPMPGPSDTSFGLASKHPSGMPDLATRLTARRSRARIRRRPESPLPDRMMSDVGDQVLDLGDTPAWLMLNRTASERLEQISAISQSLSSQGLAFRPAYSVKTNPDTRMLELVRASGLLAEGISTREVRRALATGFDPSNVILNGPAKWWPQDDDLPRLHAVFSDSLDEFEFILHRSISGRSPADMLGIRLRAPGTRSRFGISVEDPGEFARLVRLIRRLPRSEALGVHFHLASSVVGVKRWWSLYGAILEWACAIEALSDHMITGIDLGGGWFPDDFTDEFLNGLTAAMLLAKQRLPGLLEVVAEPGKAICQPSMALAVRVLEVRRQSGDPVEVVVDGSIAEVSQAADYPHRVLAHDSTLGAWVPLRRGGGRILGRLCMEEDILSRGVTLPPSVTPGDVMVICDVGAYDRSMSYEFGKG